MSILPSYLISSIQQQIETTVIDIPREYEVDFDTGQLTGRIVEGTSALKVWIWACLRTQRFRYPVYSWDYGVDLEQYAGSALTNEYLETELRDEIEAALRVNPYITGICGYVYERTGASVRIAFSVQTTLGEEIQEEYNVNL